MDPIRTKALEIVDSVDQTVRGAAQIFGFLSDERDRLDVSTLEDCVEVRFADRADEGWPGFAVSLPKSFTFFITTSSVLTRQATFRSRAPLEQVEAELTAAAIRRTSSGREWTIDRGNGVTLKVGVSTRASFVVISQRRDPDAIQASLKRRVRTDDVTPPPPPSSHARPPG